MVSLPPEGTGPTALYHLPEVAGHRLQTWSAAELAAGQDDGKPQCEDGGVVENIADGRPHR